MSIWSPHFTSVVNVRPYQGRDDHGDPQFGPVKKIPCRVEFARRQVIDSRGEQVISEILLFSDTDIPPGSLASIQGREWPALSCEPICGLGEQVDHYETRL